MAYTIQYTDSANKDDLIVEDGTINTETSLSLPGKNSTGYGQIIAEDLLHLLENFASATEPSTPVEGQLWYNNNTNQLLIYDSTSWVPSGGLRKSITQPDPNQALEGDLWVDTDNQQLYLFSGSTWVLVGPSFSQGLTTGTTPTTITGQDNLEYTVIEVQVRAQVVAIIAFDQFTPKATIPGFAATVIKPGINLANRDTSGNGINDVKFHGVAEKAESLIVSNLAIPAANFLRGDATSTTTFPVNVQNNTGIAYGINAELNVGVEGSAGVLQHNIEGSNIDVRVRNAGASKTVLRVDSSLRVGINNVAPDEALDITGNVLSSGTIKTNSTVQSTNISDGSLIVKGGAGIAKNLNVGENALIQKTLTLGSTDLTVDTNDSDVLLPDSNNTRDIGRDTLRFRRMYATTFIGNVEGTVSGNVSGKSNSSDKLTSATTFRLQGDVETVEQSFDGQTGGGLKAFDLTVKNSIISSRTSVDASEGADEFLINRSTGLAKINRSALFSSIAGLSPVGSIMPFAGASEPAGWKFCNGQELGQSLYATLYALVGYTYGPDIETTDGFFKVPDLRGRFALGNLAMGSIPAVSSPDTRSRDANAQILGAVDGDDAVLIDPSNLPEHEHDMKDPTGRQFFGMRDAVGAGDKPDGVSDSVINSGAVNSTERLSNTGGIRTDIIGSEISTLGNALNVMNPYQTINYIIYTGITGT
tara:strand:+ start:3927 stop:6029 length:2103 start_codon:yes stop_codon:yes gene_type:complete